jgi:hypothetical protein
MSDDVVQDSTEGATAEVAEPVQAPEEKQAEQTDQPGQSKEETFFDPKQVPEELVPAYKQMQAAFTKKTQEIASSKKEAEELRSQAEAFKKYQQYTPILDEMLAGNQKTSTEPGMMALEKNLRDAGYSDEAIEMMKIGAKVISNQFKEQQFQASLETKMAEAEQVDKRLNDNSLIFKTEDGESMTFGEIVAKFATSSKDWVNDPVGATKKAVKLVDSLISKSKQDGKEELSNSAKSKATKYPSIATSPQSAAKTSRLMTMEEAAEEAKSELKL